jgi:hypothetical protein
MTQRAMAPLHPGAVDNSVQTVEADALDPARIGG